METVNYRGSAGCCCHFFADSWAHRVGSVASREGAGSKTLAPDSLRAVAAITVPGSGVTDLWTVFYADKDERNQGEVVKTLA